jgi:ATPase subunit of ABC transporter with duplicated ATPase domains
MTDTPTKIVVNCETGVQEVLPLTAEEIAQMETDRLAYEAQEAERLQAEADKAALEASAVSKLEALGLTAEEIAALKS